MHVNSGHPLPPMPENPDLLRPVIPVAYPLLLLDILREHGVAIEPLIADCGIYRHDLENVEGRITPTQFAQLVTLGEQLSGHPALGYEMGLRMRLTTHGDLGYALLSSSTLGDALSLGQKFMPLRSRALHMRHRTEGEHVVIEFSERFDLGPLRQFTFESLLIGLYRAAHWLQGGVPIHINVDWPRPDYHARYEQAIPPMQFNQATVQLRLPVRALQIPLAQADATAARQAVQRCERELALLDEYRTTTERLYQLLQDHPGRYPDLETCAQRLLLSTRTLKRRLQDEGVCYQKILDDVRLRDARRLLKTTQLGLEEIARLLGYADPANFSRAFRKWTGSPPRAYREQRSSSQAG